MYGLFIIVVWESFDICEFIFRGFCEFRMYEKYSYV